MTESFNNTYDADAISYSEKVYTASGLIVNKTTLVDTVFNVDVNSTIVGTRTSDRVLSTTTNTRVVTQFQVDPLAQTFFVDERTYPNGLFLSDVDLFFRNKDDENLPVWVQIRPTVNGAPSSSFWYPESVATLYPNQVNVSENPAVSSSATATKFTFSSPMYLKPGSYALVVLTESPDYVLWAAEKGGTTRNNEFIATNPFVGTLYKSQNAMEYVPYINEDLMFRLNRCSFSTTPVNFRFESERLPSRINADKIRLIDNSIGNISRVTRVNYSMITKFESGVKETVYRNIVPNQVYSFGTNEVTAFGGRRRILQDRGDVTILLDVSTTSDHVSPIFSLESAYINAWENYIDDGEISSRNFAIVDGGSGYSNTDTILITSTSGSGATANVTVDGTGKVVGIYVSSGGSRYIDETSISYPLVGTPGSTVTANANIVLNSEYDPQGGPCDAKYITKSITLADGFDAGDIRVFLSATYQKNTEISVYYKILNGSDSTTFRDRPYRKMECVNPVLPTAKPSSSTDYREFEYRPSLTENQILYTSYDGVTYDTFKTLSIKIVLNSSDRTVLPTAKELRIIVLPGE
jgi:hypothetical protein